MPFIFLLPFTLFLANFIIGTPITPMNPHPKVWLILLKLCQLKNVGEVEQGDQHETKTEEVVVNGLEIPTPELLNELN